MFHFVNNTISIYIRYQQDLVYLAFFFCACVILPTCIHRLYPNAVAGPRSFWGGEGEHWNDKTSVVT